MRDVGKTSIDELIRRGLELHGQGQLVQAEPLYRQALQSAPDHPDSLHLLGVLCGQMRRFEEAQKLIGRAIALYPGVAILHNSLGNVLSDQGKADKSVPCYRKAIELKPDYAEAYYNLGNAWSKQGRLAEAVDSYRIALKLKPNYLEAHNNLGKALKEQGQFAQAADCYKRILQLAPDHAETYYNLGNVALDLKQPDEAMSYYRQALQRKPDYAEVHNNLGSLLSDQGKPQEAMECYRRAIQAKPDYAEACFNLGKALQEQQRLGEAMEAYRQALQRKPDYAQAYNNLGNALRDERRIAEAVECYRHALKLLPDYAEAHGNLGNALADQRQFPKAIASYRRALQLKFDHADIYCNLGNALKEQGQFEEAAECYRQALERNPDHLAAMGQLASQLQTMCQWQGLSELSIRAAKGVETSGPLKIAHTMPPFIFMAMTTPPPNGGQQLCCASKWGEEFSKSAKGARVAGASPHADRMPATRSKITLGYFSADVREHPVARLIAELFEKHDRERFTVLGYSYGPDDGSALRHRISGAFDRFADVKDSSNAQIAQRIADDGVDILIDLTGYTQHARTQVLATRPAPIQVNYLGYPGTMGATFIDYILVDDFIAPPSRQPFFTEKLVQLPGSYQANDGRREIAPNTPSRAQCGLPEKGFVFCAFHNSYKISPEMFDAWIRLLKQVPGSVLWLLEDNRFAPANLRREAQARGVAAERLVFAPRLPLPAHLARHRLADVYLDAFPVNAHTTTSDALWVGCPVLTRSGDTFISRVAGSLLTTIGLPDMVTNNLEDYERQALRLARDADYLADVRARIQANRNSCGLFDAGRFARGIEKAYTTMWEIHAAGESPRAFTVSKL